MKPSQLFLLVAMNCCWAATYSVFKLLSPWLDAGGVATLRFGLAAIVLLGCWPWLRGAAPRGRDLMRVILIGVAVFSFAPRLQVAGVQLGRAGDASVLLGLEPLIVSVSAAIFLHERIGLQRWLGFLLGLAGVLLISEVWRPDFHLPALTANALIVLSFFCDAVYSIVGKPLLSRAAALKILAVALAAGTVVNLIIDGPRTIRSVGVLSGEGWLLLAYLSLICTLAGYWLWFVVIREVPVSIVALTVFVQPVAGVVMAVLFLQESFYWRQFFGGCVIFLGLVIGFSRQIQLRMSSNWSRPTDNSV